MSKTTEKFVAAARDFCTWAESNPKTELEEIRIAVRLIANLYFCVLALPERGPGEAVEENRVSDEAWKEIFKRFGSLPFNYYSSFFSPANVAEEEPVTGDLADDFADTYRDIKEGLNLYEQGYADEAIWEWNQSFQTHWGRHLTSALHALQAYSADEGVEL